MQEKRLREILSCVLGMDCSNHCVGIDDDLCELGMNSIKFIRSVVEIENVFGIEFPDDRLILKESNSISKLMEIISQVLD